MAEHIERLDVRAFRGVPDQLNFDLSGGRSLLVFGDNATGKSTVADAIEWYFTGRIDYLSKENRGQGLRNAASRPDHETAVAVDMSGELGGRITMDEKPLTAVITTADREYFLLRGRDLSNFVEMTKGEKLRTLAGILGFDRAEAFRADLYTARTNLRNEHKSASEELQERAQALLASGLASADESSITEAATALCTQAGIGPPKSFGQAVDDTWLHEQLSHAGATDRHGSIRALQADLTATEPVVDTAPIGRWNEFVASDDAAAKAHIGMLTNAGELIRSVDVDDCPLCGQAVDVESLRQRIDRTLDGLREASQRFDEARAGMAGLLGRVERITDRLEDVRTRGTELDVELDDLPGSPIGDIRQRLDALDPVSSRLLTDHARDLGLWLAAAGRAIDQSAPGLPEGRDATFSDLTRLTVLGRQWHERRQEVAAARGAKVRAERIYAAYAKEQERHMAAVLGRISKRVADIYASLHPDEGIDGVALEAVGEKALELTVDFHGQPHRPPQRVLSESHMNSLGLALFLAMHDTYNESLGFLVLDDVVNSFDIEHRGAVAQLLVTEYADRQLIVLTHDHQFYTRLARQVPHWDRKEFVGWDFQYGPRIRGTGPEPLLDAAQMRLADDDTIGAGQRTRRALEEILLDACEKLQAPLPFLRGPDNDRREATELLKGLRRALKEHAKEMKSEIEPLLKEIEGDLQAALNVEAHAGGGRSSKAEVEAAIERINTLRSHWTCPDCETPIWLIGDPKAARCKCGSSHFPPKAPAGS